MEPGRSIRLIEKFAKLPDYNAVVAACYKLGLEMEAEQPYILIDCFTARAAILAAMAGIDEASRIRQSSVKNN